MRMIDRLIGDAEHLERTRPVRGAEVIGHRLDEIAAIDGNILGCNVGVHFGIS